MRVALCFFGLPRSMELSYILQKYYFIDPLKCDVFIHTWDINNAGYRFQSGDVGPNGENWKIIHQDAPPDDQRTNLPANPCFSKTVEDFIHQNIKPNKFEIESFELFKEKYGDGTTQAMYYSIQRSFNLMEQNENENDFKYDLVLMSRFDLIPRTYLPIDEIHKTMNEFCIFSSVNRTVDCFPNWEFKVSDMFIFGNRKVMKIYSDCFETWRNNNTLRSENVYWTTCLQNNLPMIHSKIVFLLLQKFTDNELYATFLSVPKNK
jgi:hypothetical protein